MKQNKHRQSILDKTGGFCLYCGLDIKGLKWQADHFHPIIRHPEKGTCVYPEFDTIINLFPSCAPCNNFKSASTIEGFRHSIKEQQRITLKASSGLRQLSRLGLVAFTDTKDFKFWYELNGITVPTKAELLGLDLSQLDAVVWDYNVVEECYYVEVEDGILTLRQLRDGRYQTIYTKYNYNKIGMIFLEEHFSIIKIKVLTWAMEHGIILS